MKKIIAIFGILLIFGTSALAENIQTLSPERGNDFYQDKTISDVMIERFYNSPEDIKEVNSECSEVMKWVNSSSNYGMEKYYHNAILCLTWEINKKLDKKQIELLAKIKTTFSNVIFDLMNDDHVGVLQAMYTDYECELMLVKKIYNMIYSSSIPLCFDNPVFSTPDRPSSICSTQSSSYLLGCLKKKDAKICMDKIITEKFQDILQQKSQAKSNIYHLNHFTDEFISSLYTDETQQNINVLDFYDFYIQLLDDAIYEVEYITNHNI